MLQTPLNVFHREQNAHLVDFAGWEMPVMYAGIREEHLYTRQHGSLFDVSHMGRVEFRGEGAGAFLQRLNTRNIAKLKVGQCGYSHMCKEDGGILDDVIVSRYQDRFLVVCNASNREKLLGWFDSQRRGFDVDILDRTLNTAMVALQGPEVMDAMARLLPVPIGDLKRYHFKTGNLMGAEYYVARSGYTGEDGVEIILPANLTLMAVRMLMDRAQELDHPIKPAGLGARDTLRLEAGMPLYGHELGEDRDSITAGQGWCVDLSKDFIGRDALQRVQQAGPQRQIVGFELEGKRIAREGTRVFRNGRNVGFVTSGTLSPTLEKIIAMGLIDAGCAEPGTSVEMDLRSTPIPASVVPLPFYKRSR